MLFICVSTVEQSTFYRLETFPLIHHSEPLTVYIYVKDSIPALTNNVSLLLLTVKNKAHCDGLRSVHP